MAKNKYSVYQTQLDVEKLKLAKVKLFGLNENTWLDYGFFEDTFVYEVPNNSQIGDVGRFPLRNDWHEGVIIDFVSVNDMKQKSWFPEGMRSAYDVHKPMLIIDGKLKSYMGFDEIVFVPFGITTIGTGAFDNVKAQRYVKKVVLSPSVVEIEEEAFAENIEIEGCVLKWMVI